MSLRSRRFLRLLLPMIAVMCLSAAPQQQLSPTVTVLPAARSTVPPECEEGLAPQPRPRVTSEEKAVAREVAARPELEAPPTNDLRTSLRDLETALERNDRSTFVDSLARVKTLLATYPAGGERTGAEKAVAVYNDIDTLWDYQLTPRGAFFDASSDLFKMLSAYPGYDTFIRRQILVDQTGAKFYPSSESRAFLSQIAASRLREVGIKSAAAQSTPPAVAHKPPVTSTTTREKAPAVHETSPKTQEATAAVPAPHKQHVATAAPKHHRAARDKKPLQVAEAKPAPTGKSTEATTVKKTIVTGKAPAAEAKTATSETKAARTTPIVTTSEKPATTATAAPPPPTRSVSEAAPAASSTTALPAAAPSPTATSTNLTPSATASTAGIETTSSATATQTTATEATATSAPIDTAVTDTTGTAGEKDQSGRPGEPRNLLWPIILIVVGVGVLILLFRTSPGPK